MPELIVQNGVGYDGVHEQDRVRFAELQRKVIVVQHVLGLPDSTPNPHLWYNPKTMPAVAKVMAADLVSLDPSHQAYFEANLQAFDASLQPWFNAIAAFKAKYAGTPVATTEPVADYLLQAMGAKNLTPFVLPGRHHERRRPRAGGHHAGGWVLHQAPGQGVLLQPAGGRLAHHLDPPDSANRPAFRSSASTRPCRRRATTTSPGCSPRSPRSRAPSHTADRRSTCERRHPSWRGRRRSSVSFSGRKILDEVSFEIRRGEFTGLIGSNGVGKTTLLRVDSWAAAPGLGPCRVLGRRCSRGADHLGYVPQKVVLDPDIPMRARDLVALGLDGSSLRFRPTNRAQRELVEEMLDAVDAERFADRGSAASREESNSGY